MLKQINMVREFHTTFGAPVADVPGICNPDRLTLRARLILEEAKEFLEGAGLDVNVNGEIVDNPLRVNRDLVLMADALMDLLYVTYGTLIELGMGERSEAMFAHVHASNMSKVGEDGKPVLRTDGKILKGPNFFPPELGQFLSAEKEIRVTFIIANDMNQYFGMADIPKNWMSDACALQLWVPEMNNAFQFDSEESAHSFLSKGIERNAPVFQNQRMSVVPL